MKFSVPINWQTDLLDTIDISSVAEVYGKMEPDCLGGAHASCLLPSAGRKALCREVGRAHSLGLAFNYLLNPVCTGNMEWTRGGQVRIRRLLDVISLAGADGVTVSTPYLLALVKKSFPHFKISVSVGAAVDTPARAAYWEDMGAEQITLSCVDVNRDFRLLGAIRRRVHCHLQLIANLPCLPNCHLQRYHGNISSHASRRRETGSFHIDYCSLLCRFMRLSEPERMLSAVWIRPEDVRFYEEAGVDRIKLVDRGMKSAELARIVSAYTAGRYEGNLLDLFPFNTDKYVVNFAPQILKKFFYFFRPFQYDILRLAALGRALSAGGIYLDNRKLDGFLEFFRQGKCRGYDCSSCGYCRDATSKALTVSAGIKEAALRTYRRALDDLAGGGIFFIKDKSRSGRK
ncbi:MAG: U32 family peptidase [Candidatus Omnitrophota bacterium]|jgi:collagenase-like PrtC family protease